MKFFYINKSTVIISLLATMSLLNSIAAMADIPSLMEQNQSKAAILYVQEQPIIISPQPLVPTYQQPSFSALNEYQWQLIQIIDEQGNTTTIPAAPPLTMDVRPNNLVFQDGCRQYLFKFFDGSAGDFPYRMYGSAQLSNRCNIKKSANASVSAVDDNHIELGLKNTLIYGGHLGFGFKFLKPNSHLATAALNINQGKTLIWQGTRKELKPTTGLPITTTLLENYKWRLVSAIDGDNQSIAELNYRDIPIYGSFYTNNKYSGASFSTGCNGVGGAYILTNNILLIGTAPQTMIGCGSKREAAEDKLKALELLSRSQLTLEHYSNNDANSFNKKVLDTPNYLLTQKLDSGETLVWRSEDKDVP